MDNKAEKDDKRGPPALRQIVECGTPYEPPSLTIHGTLAEMTQGAKAGTSDIGGLTATNL